MSIEVDFVLIPMSKSPPSRFFIFIEQFSNFYVNSYIQSWRDCSKMTVGTLTTTDQASSRCERIYCYCQPLCNVEIAVLELVG